MESMQNSERAPSNAIRQAAIAAIVKRLKRLREQGHGPDHPEPAAP
tara:strand:+ start:15723 stop:15860 length:138 start_codon:yes stop_codon:yes gene_type:complete